MARWGKPLYLAELSEHPFELAELSAVNTHALSDSQFTLSQVQTASGEAIR